MATTAEYVNMLVASAAYNEVNKRNFHRAAKTLLQRLALRLDMSGSSDAKAGYGERSPIRSNKGGIAVSGEITLHYDRVYIQVCQPCTNRTPYPTGIMFRTCRSRTDYSGGHNNFAPIASLADTEQLARLIEARCPFSTTNGV